jgi:putative transposase
MPFIKIWVHTVWSTKDRIPFLNKELRELVFIHIRENAQNKNIIVDQINGYDDHIHCLVSLNAEHNIATIMNLLKGESSFWINKNKLTKKKFSWHDEYFAVSVGHSQIQTIRNYIINQEKYHKKRTFQHEYEDFIKKYEFELIKG